LISCFKRYNPSSKIRSLREYERRARIWRPTPAGDNHPPWWDIPAVLLQDSPFEGSSWELPSTPRNLLDRKIFHEEGCSCPTGAIPIPIPGRSYFQGVERDRDECKDRRFNTNTIQVCVDQEFNRLFAQAREADTHCSAAQELWRVFHYCNLPCNAGRTRKGTSLGRLLHHVAYDAFNHDCLRWLRPGQSDRHHLSALRIIPVIIEQCIFKTRQHGPKGIAPPVPGTWGFNLPSLSTVIKYAYLREQSPATALLNYKIHKFVAVEHGEAEPLAEAPCQCPIMLSYHPLRE
jgi:hypothetical protein